jgi:hypothetical protein
LLLFITRDLAIYGLKQRNTKGIKYYKFVVREILISVSLCDLEHRNVLKATDNYIFRQDIKVKYTLVQALRLCTGRKAHRGSRSIALLRLCTGRTAHRGSRGIALLSLLYRPYGP